MTRQAAQPDSPNTRSPLSVPPSWAQSRLSRHVRINEGLVDPEMEPYSSMPLIAPNHVESGTGRILYTESSHEQGAASGKYLVRRGQVIYSKIRPNLMKVALAPTDCLCSADMYGLEGNHGQIDNGYLKWFLLSREFTEQIVLESLRSALPKVNRDSLGAMKIWFPSIVEQVQLARFLDRETAEIDELVGKQERLMELLAEKRQAIITHTVTKGLDPTAPTMPSGVPWPGDINASWPVRPLKAAGQISLGKMIQPGPKAETDFEAPYLRAANVQPNGVLALGDVKKMWFNDSELRSLDVRSGDVVVVEGGIGGFGRAAYVNRDLPGFGYQNSINRIRPSKWVDGRFLTYLLLTARNAGYIHAYSTGVSMPHLTSEKLAAISVPLPDRATQTKISDHLDARLTKLNALSGKASAVITTLHERRSALVSAAVTGSLQSFHN